MKNKRGFTLVEILIVIVIIGVIMSIAIPAAMMIGDSIKERSFNGKMQTYLVAAEQYAKNNKYVFGAETVIQISVETLLAYGYVEEEYSCARAYGCIEDPRDSSAIMNDEPITLKINGNIAQALIGPMEVELSLSFDTNGASSISATAVGCQTLNGSACSVTLPTITRAGYTILGWNKLSSGTSATYAPGATVDIYENATYYAITSKSLTLTFNKNTASSISANSSNCTMYNTQTNCSVTMPTITPNSGYSVIGWNTNSGATTKQYDVSQSISISANNTYYAITKLITYTCYKAVASTSCSYTSTASAISACQGAGYTNCVTNGCDSSMWIYNYQFTIHYGDDNDWMCYVRGRTSLHLSLACSSSNIKELLLTGNDGIQDLTNHYCDSLYVSPRTATLYWSGGDSNDIQLVNATIDGCITNECWATPVSGYITKWDYAGDSYLYGQTSCPAGYSSTLE